MTKQVIVLRTDLKMPTGKAVAQGAHASLKVFFDRINRAASVGGKLVIENIQSEEYDWIHGIFTKIALGCDSEADLVALYEKAKEANLPHSLIQDAGKTVFNEVTTTCIAIGPGPVEAINAITGHLKMYKY
jgi:PTH2 family peptidyl-tRNA hydrolase